MCKNMNLIDANITKQTIKNKTSFKEDIQSAYKDPLMQWPLRGCAYSNEVGAAIHGISPKLGTALWIPALMYFGADIYDKYKNDETIYNPSKKRGVKETVFQALASVLMPTGAVCLGQKAASSLNRFAQDELTSQSKIDVIEKSMDYMESQRLSSFADKKQEYAKEFKTSILEAANNSRDDFKALSPLKKALAFLNPFNDNDSIAFAKKDKLGNFAQKQALEVMEMREQLMKNRKPKNMSKKLFEKFKTLKQEYAKIYPENHIGKAAKSILKDHHQNQIFKNKLVKTAGGFVSLALLIKPIDNFVEHIVIKKTVEPGLDYISENYKNSRHFRRYSNATEQ